MVVKSYVIFVKISLFRLVVQSISALYSVPLIMCVYCQYHTSQLL